MSAPFSIGPGIDIGSGINIGIDPPPPVLMLNLDAAGYAGSGPWIDTVNSLSFTLNNSPTYSGIIGGGSFNFDPASSQWANSSASLSNLSTWTVVAWHYYAGTNTGFAPCIVTELYPSVTNTINYTLGSTISGSTNLQAGFFNGAWETTATGYSLTSSNWYQIVGTYDGSSVKLYVNNTLINTTNYSGTPTSGGSGIRLMRRWDDADYWGGRLAIVQIYEGAFNAPHVATNWNTNKARFGL